MELLRKYALGLPLALSALLLAGLMLSSGYAQDDFGWLNLRARLANQESWFELFFAPMAQGTFRTLSERLPFLLFSLLAGLEPLPFRTLHLIITAANLFCWYRLLKSFGVPVCYAAPALACWYWNPSLVKAHLWSSALNQSFQALMIALCLLAQPRPWLFWLLFTASLGVHELCVLIPLYLMAVKGRKALPNVWWIATLATALLFMAVTRLVSYQFAGSTYLLSLRPSSLFTNFVAYAQLSNPGRLASVILLAIMLAGLLQKAWIKSNLSRLAISLLSPLLVYLALPNIQNGYYLFVPLLGLAILLCQFGIVIARQHGISPSVISAALLLILGSQISMAFKPFLEFAAGSNAINGIIRDVARSALGNPTQPVIVFGLTHRQYHLGWADDPFRMLGLTRIYLAPGSFDRLADPYDPIFFYSKFVDSSEMRRALSSNTYQTLLVSSAGVRPLSPSERKLMLSAKIDSVFRTFHMATAEIDSGFRGIGDLEGDLRWTQSNFHLPIELSPHQLYSLGISAYATGSPCEIKIQAAKVGFASFTLSPGWQRLEAEKLFIQRPATHLEATVIGSCQIALQDLVLTP